MQILRWNLGHAIIMLLSWAVFSLTGWIFVISIIGLLSFSYFIFQYITHAQANSFFGYANYLTSLRILCIAVLGIFINLLDHSVIFTILMSVVLLDVFDGKIARVRNEVSEFGSYLDMEADAFYVLTASVLLHFSDFFPGWIVLIGLLRYIHVILARIVLPQKNNEPRLRINAIAAGILFVSLPLPFISDHTLVNIAVILSCLLVASTFIVSFSLMKFGHSK